MRKRIQEAIKHPLIAGSGIIFIGTFLGNILNFLFNVYMGRTLSTSDYGILSAIVSILTLFGLAAGALVPTIVHFSGTYFADKKLDLVRGLFMRMSNIAFLIGLFSTGIFVIFSKAIGEFFHLRSPELIILTGVIVAFEFLIVVNTAFLQAKLSFYFISFMNLFSSILKLGLGIFFVSIGLGVSAPVLAYFFAFFLPYAVSFIPLSFIFSVKKGKNPHVGTKELIMYGAPSAIALLCLTSFITTDIILVKHFFKSSDVGVYAALSLIGKVIFFFSAPIATVMFPLIVQKYSKKENYHNTFHLSLLLVLLPSLCLTVFYFLFPLFIIQLFFNRAEYNAAAPLLGWYGVLMTLYSVNNILINFLLSIKKTKVYIPILIGSILQIGFIWYFHKTFAEIIAISISILSLLIAILLLYYVRLRKE